MPPARRADWEKLIAGLERELDARREARVDAAPERSEGPVARPTTRGGRARVQGLLRACKLFCDGTREWTDGCDRIPGLGPVARDELARRGIRTVADLVWLLPVGWDDLRAPTTVKGALEKARQAELAGSPAAARACVVGTVVSSTLIPMRGRRAVRVVVADDAGDKVDAWWFFAAHGIRATAKPGARCLLLGKVSRDASNPRRNAKMAHPDLVVDEPSARGVRPRYPRMGVAGATLRKSIGAALDVLEALPDPVPARIVERERMPPVEPLLRAMHGRSGLLREPPSEEVRRAAVERLAWVEAFSHVWERLLAESRWGGARAPVLERDDAVLARLESALGFSLTTSQRRAIDAIAADLASPAPMRRLLLGDVGTGKTAVAMAAAAQCVTAGYQAAILAPTSVLAEQYRDALAPLARATMRDVALVSAGVPSAERRRAEAHLADGKVAVAAGTHALLSGSVTFARLGLVIVDEQHRLGVAQRLALVSKGTRPHLLTLSATPIPRTLALALRGELATCTLDERPRGRPPVETLTMPRERMTEVLALVRDATSRGERVFFVSPRIEVDAEDPEDDPSAAAVERAAELARALDPVRVEIVHGAMSAQQKRDAMRAFRSGDALVLVGTTVIEVGIDVPEATLMIVDRAERFGLAQLHQLRGRVGRGDRPGRCVLLHGELEPLAARRLEALVASSSGFEIARADLALRGAGDLWGTRQSGAEEELLYLDPSRPPPWLERIEDDARALRAVDPELVHPDHRGLALARARIAVAMAVREEAG